MIRYVLFDMDGTLTDSKDGIVKSTIYAFQEMGLPIPAEGEIEIGPPILQTLARLLGPHKESRYDEAVRWYRKRYAEKGVYECRVYPGIAELLSHLGAASVATFVATAKPTVFAQQILEHFGLAHHFTRIYGSELDGTRTDKAELIAHILALEGLDPGAAVMVGDRKHDVLGAGKCGVVTLGAGWGYGSEEELRTAGARTVCRHPDEILPWLAV